MTAPGFGSGLKVLSFGRVYLVRQLLGFRCGLLLTDVLLIPFAARLTSDGHGQDVWMLMVLRGFKLPVERNGFGLNRLELVASTVQRLHIYFVQPDSRLDSQL